MAFARWERPIQDGAGNLITNVWCEVRREDVSGNPKATLYSDREGATPLANPFLATDGEPAFHAAGGSYRVRIYKTGYDKTYNYQALGTGAEIDADSLLIPGYLFEFETATTAPPGEGGIRANNADLSAATRLYIDKETIAAIDVSPRIEALADKRVLLTSTNAGEQVSWSVGLVTDEGDHYELVLSEHVGATEIVAGRCGMQREGTQGTAGLNGLFTGEEVTLTTTSETLVTSYRGQTIILDSASPMTLAAQAAATLGDDWAVILKNIGAGTVTLDPDGAETIDGAATLTIATGDSLLVFSNGTVLRSIAMSHAVQPVPKGGTGSVTSPAALAALAAQSANGHSNMALVASVGSNALTVSLKGADGNDPSAANPVVLAFRDASLASGVPVVRTVTAALSITVPNGGTMGFTNNTAGRLWVVAFDDAGTIRLGLVNCLSGTSIYPLRTGDIASGTNVGTGSDNAHVIYSGGAVTSKALIVLGYLDWASGLATVGQWASGPTAIQLATAGVPMPGDVVQTQRTDTGDHASGTTAIPLDNTVPQITEGDEYMTQAITPKAAANILTVRARMIFAPNGASHVVTALFRDSTAGALSACVNLCGDDNPGHNDIYHRVRAGSVSATTMRIRAGTQTTNSLDFNGRNGARTYGGVLNSFLEVSELMA